MRDSDLLRTDQLLREGRAALQRLRESEALSRLQVRSSRRVIEETRQLLRESSVTDDEDERETTPAR